MFTLRFGKAAIPEWAARYPVDYDTSIETNIAPLVKAQGYFTQAEFIELCRWKTPRSKPLVKSNAEDYIRATTQTALSTPSERLRIEVLTLLDGVSWATASVLLHFGHHDPYPILDFRALWSLGVYVTQVHYDFDFWWEYTQFCRQLASESGVSMRGLDRALWQYSAEKQRK